jgi:hypothetical protein
MLVAMERSYITAGFFRYTMSRRYAAMQQQAVLQQAIAKGQPGAPGAKRGLAGMLSRGRDGDGAVRAGGAGSGRKGARAAC